MYGVNWGENPGVVGDRFWYNKNWADDVDSYYYNSWKRIIFISPILPIYGFGGVYELDLKNKKWKMIFPESKEELKKLQDEETYGILFQVLKRVC